MENQSEQTWKLFVNGVEKAWPIKDYMNTSITIDLNWGIDTSIYETFPLTFVLQELLSGKLVQGVSVDKEEHKVVCVIPIIEKAKKYKVIIDWRDLKTSIKSNLTASVNGKYVPIDNGILTLKGSNINSLPILYYKKKKCKITTDGDTITVILPKESSRKLGIEMPSNIKDWIFLFLPGVILSSLIAILIGLVIKISEGKVSPVVIAPDKSDVFEEKSDPIYVIDNSGLNDAIRYLDENERWNKDEMEQFPCLKGLFEAMNSFDYNTLISEYSSLAGSNKFQEIVSASENCIKKGIMPRRPRYVEEQDNIITFHLYLRMIRNSKMDGKHHVDPIHPKIEQYENENLSTLKNTKTINE